MDIPTTIRHKKIMMLLVMVLCAMTVSGQTAVWMDVDRAVEMALTNNKGIAASRMTIASAEALRATASELPATAFDFQYGNNEGFELNNGFAVSQSIPFPTVFGARKQQLKQQVQLRQQETAVAENRLRAAVRSSYYRLMFLQHQSLRLARLDSIYQEFIGIASVRYQAGDTKKIDLSAAQLKRGDLKLMMEENNVAISTAYLDLKRLIQSEDDFTLPAGEVSAYVPLTPIALMEDAQMEDHPEVQRMVEEVELLAGQKRLVKGEALPTLTLGYSNVSLIGNHERNGVEQYYGVGQRFSYVDIGLSLPLTFGATKARMRALTLDQQSAALRAQDKQQELTLSYQQALRTYGQYRHQYEYFRDQALAYADELVEDAAVGYRAGDTSYLEYLYALQSATDIYLNYLKSIQQVNESVVNLYMFINK